MFVVAGLISADIALAIAPLVGG
jgi:hypothetical protein